MKRSTVRKNLSGIFDAAVGSKAKPFALGEKPKKTKKKKASKDTLAPALRPVDVALAFSDNEPESIDDYIAEMKGSSARPSVPTSDLASIQTPMSVEPPIRSRPDANTTRMFRQPIPYIQRIGLRHIEGREARPAYAKAQTYIEARYQFIAEYFPHRLAEYEPVYNFYKQYVGDERNESFRIQFVDYIAAYMSRFQF